MVALPLPGRGGRMCTSNCWLYAGKGGGGGGGAKGVRCGRGWFPPTSAWESAVSSPIEKLCNFGFSIKNPIVNSMHCYTVF